MTTDKKIKPDAPVVTAVAPTPGAWFPIHETNSHDLKTCRTVYGLTKTARSVSWSVELQATPATATAVANLATCRGTVLGCFSEEAKRAAGEKGMQVLGEDMAVAMAIRPGNPIAMLLPSPEKWELPESTRRKLPWSASMVG
jgi:hypothetical protein